MNIHIIAMRVIGGQSGLEKLKELAKQRTMTSGLIRQLFFLVAMDSVRLMCPSVLGMVVSEGQCLCPEGDFRNRTLVLSGGSCGYWEVTLSDYDSGLVLLQKLATASILARIIDLVTLNISEINDKQPWTPYEVFQIFKGDSELICTEFECIKKLKRELNWQ